MESSADLEQVNDQPKKCSEHTKRAWLTVAGSFLVYFVSFGYMNSFGYFQDYYTQNDLADYSPSLVSFIGSLQLGLMYLVGPIAGVLYDAYSATWLYLIAAFGGIVSCVGVSFAKPEQIWQHMLSQGVLFGVTVPFGTNVALPIASQHFKQSRALAIGVVASGSSLGGVCLPIMYSYVVPRIGFSWSLRLTSLIILAFYGAAIIISTPNVPRKSLRSARNILDFGGFRDVRYCTLALANVVGNFGLYVPFFYLEPYIAVHHPGAAVGSFLLPMINGSSFFGRIIGGFVADHVGGLNLLYPLTMLSGVLCLTIWLLATGVGIIVSFACLYGFCSGILISVMSSVVIRISPENKIGARLGAFSTWSAIGVFTGTPIGGAIVRNGTVMEYQHIIIYTGTCMTAAGALLLVARLLCDRNLRTKW
ncbi:hypothetical protein AK830_g5802 [Neonectria ditissima]|uniref:Major facilitator superfamily (MFS) profile domain-containing protein n=1 Tax=Neonectria ditissima TaxID=78410 RepID=A0A0N8H743_9HYPO|nr:hypothetical protein AK830_g5802 [Neonectria ditissima]